MLSLIDDHVENLLRGCLRRPDGKGTLCAAHATADSSHSAPAFADVCARRLRRALHNNDDVGYLQVQLEG